MSLLDILGCPLCKTRVERQGDKLRCVQCRREYPIIKGVPIMLPDWDGSNIEHEGELILRHGYDYYNHLMLTSLHDNQVALDGGCGNMDLDDPCLIRMDVRLTPYVDVVGDMHAAPFQPGTIDLFMSLAVFEHLRQPFTAAEEIYKLLKAGGYVYSDCCSIFPYHGYPHHYFNATKNGMEQLFAQFRELRAGVAPYQMPSFVLEAYLLSYQAHFKPTNPAEYEFLSMIHRILEHPMRYYDSKFLDPEITYRVSAGNYVIGMKQPSGKETVVPPVVMDVYARSPELQRRFPNPSDITVKDNLLLWAKKEGAAQYPEIAAYLKNQRTFSKYLDPSRPLDRSKIHGWVPHDPQDWKICCTTEEMECFRNGIPTLPQFAPKAAAPAVTEEAKPAPRTTLRLMRRALEILEDQGVKGLTKKVLKRIQG